MSRTEAFRENLEKQGFLVQPFHGVSMMPLLRQGRDAVRLVKPQRPLKKMDIVLFERPDGQLVLHRIIRIRNGEYYIRGDNCIGCELVQAEQILCIAEGIYRDGVYLPVSRPLVRWYGIRQHLTLPWRRMRFRLEVRRLQKKKKEKQRVIDVFPKEFDLFSRLLRAAVLDTDSPVFPEDTDWKKLVYVARTQKLAAMVFPKLPRERMPEELYAKWKRQRDFSVRKTLLFDAERQAILAELEKRGIAYMPLKGVWTNKLYPLGAREFSDNDILIHPECSDEVRSFLEQRGYTLKQSDLHDEYHKDPFFNFEIHKGLFYENQVGYAEFRDIWNRVIRIEGTGYGWKMTNEDMLVYEVAHFCKHYRNGGTGLRGLADLYQMQTHFENLDNAYVDALLKRAGLTDFYAFLCRLCDDVFGSGNGEISDRKVAHYMYSSGLYGIEEHTIANEVASEGKLRYALRRIFLPYAKMKERFPVLRKVPVLLPVFWVVRVILFVTDGKRKNEIRQGMKDEP